MIRPKPWLSLQIFQDFVFVYLMDQISFIISIYLLGLISFLVYIFPSMPYIGAELGKKEG